MSQRFQIQDIVAQDLGGVTFRALDIESGATVAVRRFFPFGAEGGGLFDDQRAAYDAAVARVAGFKHPGLRAVLTGGCDPVDGMPFVVTEWITGERLAEKLEHGVLSAAGAARVLGRALELSELLSQVLGEEAVWVETSPWLIIEDGEAGGRGLTFALCPMKWLGGEVSRRSLLALAELAEELLGWRGLQLPDEAGNGLGAWVGWLRVNAATLTLSQARKCLAGFAGGTVPEPAITVVLPSSTPEEFVTPSEEFVTPSETFVTPPEVDELPVLALPPVAPLRKKKPASREPWILIAVLVVLLGSGGWWVVRQQAVSRARRAVANAAATSQAATPSPPVAAFTSPAVPVAQDGGAGKAAGRVFQSGDTQLLLRERGREVTVEGVLKNVRSSDSGKTLYLEFVETTQREEARGLVVTRNTIGDMSEAALKPLIDKRIRITGVVRIMRRAKVQWPEILLVDRKSIQEVK